MSKPFSPRLPKGTFSQKIVTPSHYSEDAEHLPRWATADAPALSPLAARNVASQQPKGRTILANPYMTEAGITSLMYDSPAAPPTPMPAWGLHASRTAPLGSALTSADAPGVPFSLSTMVNPSPPKIVTRSPSGRPIGPAAAGRRGARDDVEPHEKPGPSRHKTTGRSPVYAVSRSKSKRRSSRTPPPARSKSTRRREADILKRQLSEALLRIDGQHATIAHQSSVLKHVQGDLVSAKQAIREKEHKMSLLRDRASDLARALDSVASRAASQDPLSEQELSQVTLLLQSILQQLEIDYDSVMSSTPVPGTTSPALSAPRATGTSSPRSPLHGPRIPDPTASDRALQRSGRPRLAGGIPSAGRVVVTAVGGEVHGLPPCDVYLSLALVGHRNPPAVTRPVPYAAGDTFIMWSKSDSPSHALLFSNVAASGGLQLQVEAWKRVRRRDEFVGKGEASLEEFLRGIAADPKLPINLVNVSNEDVGAIIVDVRLVAEEGAPLLDASTLSPTRSGSKRQVSPDVKPALPTVAMEVPIGKGTDDLVLPVTIIRASRLPTRHNGSRPDAFVRLAVAGDRLEGTHAATRSVWDLPSSPLSPKTEPLELLVEVWDRQVAGSTFIGRGALPLDRSALEPGASALAQSSPSLQAGGNEVRCKIVDASGADAGVVTLSIGRVVSRARTAKPAAAETVTEVNRRLSLEKHARKPSAASNTASDAPTEPAAAPRKAVAAQGSVPVPESDAVAAPASNRKPTSAAVTPEAAQPRVTRKVSISTEKPVAAADEDSLTLLAREAPTPAKSAFTGDPVASPATAKGGKSSSAPTDAVQVPTSSANSPQAVSSQVAPAVSPLKAVPVSDAVSASVTSAVAAVSKAPEAVNLPSTPRGTPSVLMSELDPTTPTGLAVSVMASKALAGWSTSLVGPDKPVDKRTSSPPKRPVLGMPAAAPSPPKPAAAPAPSGPPPAGSSGAIPPSVPAPPVMPLSARAGSAAPPTSMNQPPLPPGRPLPTSAQLAAGRDAPVAANPPRVTRPETPPASPPTYAIRVGMSGPALDLMSSPVSAAPAALVTVSSASSAHADAPIAVDAPAVSESDAAVVKNSAPLSSSAPAPAIEALLPSSLSSASVSAAVPAVSASSAVDVVASSSSASLVVPSMSSSAPSLATVDQLVAAAVPLVSSEVHGSHATPLLGSTIPVTPAAVVAVSSPVPSAVVDVQPFPVSSSVADAAPLHAPVPAAIPASTVSASVAAGDGHSGLAAPGNVSTPVESAVATVTSDSVVSTAVAISVPVVEVLPATAVPGVPPTSGIVLADATKEAVIVAVNTADSPAPAVTASGTTADIVSPGEPKPVDSAPPAEAKPVDIVPTAEARPADEMKPAEEVKADATTAPADTIVPEPDVAVKPEEPPAGTFVAPRSMLNLPKSLGAPALAVASPSVEALAQALPKPPPKPAMFAVKMPPKITKPAIRPVVVPAPSAMPAVIPPSPTASSTPVAAKTPSDVIPPVSPVKIVPPSPSGTSSQPAVPEPSSPPKPDVAAPRPFAPPPDGNPPVATPPAVPDTASASSSVAARSAMFARGPSNPKLPVGKPGVAVPAARGPARGPAQPATTSLLVPPAPAKKPAAGKPDELPVAKPADASADVPVADGRSAAKPADVPSELPSGKPAGKLDERPAANPTDAAAEMPTDKSVDKHGGQPMENPDEKPAAIDSANTSAAEPAIAGKDAAPLSMDASSTAATEEQQPCDSPRVSVPTVAADANASSSVPPQEPIASLVGAPAEASSDAAASASITPPVDAAPAVRPTPPVARPPPPRPSAGLPAAASDAADAARPAVASTGAPPRPPGPRPSGDSSAAASPRPPPPRPGMPTAAVASGSAPISVQGSVEGEPRAPTPPVEGAPAARPAPPGARPPPPRSSVGPPAAASDAVDAARPAVASGGASTLPPKPPGPRPSGEGSAAASPRPPPPRPGMPATAASASDAPGAVPSSSAASANVTPPVDGASAEVRPAPPGARPPPPRPLAGPPAAASDAVDSTRPAVASTNASTLPPKPPGPRPGSDGNAAASPRPPPPRPATAASAAPSDTAASANVAPPVDGAPVVRPAPPGARPPPPRPSSSPPAAASAANDAARPAVASTGAPPRPPPVKPGESPAALPPKPPGPRPSGDGSAAASPRPPPPRPAPAST